jgi:hypothetical protein
MGASRREETLALLSEAEIRVRGIRLFVTDANLMGCAETCRAMVLEIDQRTNRASVRSSP